MNDNRLEIIYLYIHTKIGEPIWNGHLGDCTMSICEVKKKMYLWRIPDELRPIIIKVWEQMGIVEKVNKKKIKFIKTEFDLSKVNKMYENFGIF